MALPTYVHIVDTVTNNTTSISLTVSNSDNITASEFFLFRCPKAVSQLVTGDAIPVTIEVNNVQVPLKNMYGKQILSNRVPKRSKNGRYMIETASGTPAPYVILLDEIPIQNA